MGSPWEIVMFYLLDISVNSVPEKYIIISISYTNLIKMTRKIFSITVDCMFEVRGSKYRCVLQLFHWFLFLWFESGSVDCSFR